MKEGKWNSNIQFPSTYETKTTDPVQKGAFNYSIIINFALVRKANTASDPFPFKTHIYVILNRDELGKVSKFYHLCICPQYCFKRSSAHEWHLTNKYLQKDNIYDQKLLVILVLYQIWIEFSCLKSRLFMCTLYMVFSVQL